jgi:hypothetical protein
MFWRVALFVPGFTRLPRRQAALSLVPSTSVTEHAKAAIGGRVKGGH